MSKGSEVRPTRAISRALEFGVKGMGWVRFFLLGDAVCRA